MVGNPSRICQWGTTRNLPPLGRVWPLRFCWTQGHQPPPVTPSVSHYEGERHHQGLGGNLIIANDNIERAEADVHCRERLGGMLTFYYRDAA
jgi:hypothetical protein